MTEYTRAVLGCAGMTEPQGPFYIGVNFETGELDTDTLVCDGAPIATVKIRPGASMTLPTPDGEKTIPLARIRESMAKMAELLVEADQEVRGLQVQVNKLKKAAKR